MKAEFLSWITFTHTFVQLYAVMYVLISVLVWIYLEVSITENVKNSFIRIAYNFLLLSNRLAFNCKYNTNTSIYSIPSRLINYDFIQIKFYHSNLWMGNICRLTVKKQICRWHLYLKKRTKNFRCYGNH